MRQFGYLIIDLGCLIIPFIASFYSPRPFYKYWKAFFFSCSAVLIPFVIWDSIFTAQGIWGFNSDYLTGVHFLNLPIEEILFFICIPYACVFTYFAFKYLFPNNPLGKVHKTITFIFLLISLLFIIEGWDKLYTFYTGLFTFSMLIFCLWKKVNMGFLYFTYFSIIPFFILSNGLLTGSLLENPIVWYNDFENLGIRIITIPIEDFIYALLLIALNIMLFDEFSRSTLNRDSNPTS